MKTKLGNCIKIACESVMDNDNLLFCSAYVMGQGKLKGQRILHAWIEEQDVVFDNSNGKRIVMRKEQYYKIAQITEKDIIRQTAEEVRKLMFQTKTYGGWIK